MNPINPPVPLDLTQVDGVKVEARKPAEGIAPDGLSMSEIKTVDEILLTDGRVLYQCVYPVYGCGKTFETPRSVTAHQRMHGGKTRARAAEKQLAQIDANKRSAKQRRIDGAAKGLATKRSRAQVDNVAMTRIAVIDELGIAGDMVREGLARLESAVHAALTIAPEIDPKILEKATKYDQMRGLLG